MINPNNNLPLTAHKQLKKVTQASLIAERKQKVDAKSEEKKDPPEEQSKKRPPKGLLDIYV
ncbi:hypothetical protein MD588_01710 [Photobacterium sp. SDRW27]|uniref:hypothetical protein n=1 Tax=Photobacterium obscurum TaxID=2829490 RepID=UPI002244246D|nr:hypothetical protein [Photobacterium obscurum]MCW8327517.1 hypothetical protein [Photobacterium obscurum]